jgi:hypothetical protein
MEQGNGGNGDGSRHVLRLVPRGEQPPPGQPQIVGMLAELLELAKQGKIEALCVTSWLAETDAANVRWSPLNSLSMRARMVGVLQLAIREILAEVTFGRRG